ncbi:VOC family protein [Enterococcus sp. LJL99]
MAFVHHLCIQTNQYQASLAFYQQIGFELVHETPDFHERAYNSWLQLGEFYIELQTGKQELTQHENKEYTGLVHFCLYVEELEKFIQKKQLPEKLFVKKNNQQIYQVGSTNLCKVIAPEGTIVEFRDNISF